MIDIDSTVIFLVFSSHNDDIDENNVVQWW